MTELQRFHVSGPVMVIAELSGNHNGSLARARELIHAAKESGADAVKLQTYTADTMTIDAPTPWFAIEGGPWGGRRLHELYREASTPWDWHSELFAEAARLDLPCFSTPFDHTAIDFLEGLACPYYKVASFEVPDLPLLKRIAATRKPVIMSTGMASLTEIDEAVTTLRRGGTPQLALLACVSAYPARVEDMRLRNVPHLAETFSCVGGISDHSPGHAVACAAVALGARIVEKHLTLRRSDGGPDAAFSLEPAEFTDLTAAVRSVAVALKNPVEFGVRAPESGSLVFRRSLFVVTDIPPGGEFTVANVRVIRPGHGLPPKDLPLVLGRRAARPIVRGTPLTWDLIA